MLQAQCIYLTSSLLSSEKLFQSFIRTLKVQNFLIMFNLFILLCVWFPCNQEQYTDGELGYKRKRGDDHLCLVSILLAHSGSSPLCWSERWSPKLLMS